MTVLSPFCCLSFSCQVIFHSRESEAVCGMSDRFASVVDSRAVAPRDELVLRVQALCQAHQLQTLLPFQVSLSSFSFFLSFLDSSPFLFPGCCRMKTEGQVEVKTKRQFWPQAHQLQSFMPFQVLSSFSLSFLLLFVLFPLTCHFFMLTILFVFSISLFFSSLLSALCMMRRNPFFFPLPILIPLITTLERVSNVEKSLQPSHRVPLPPPHFRHHHYHHHHHHLLLLLSPIIVVIVFLLLPQRVRKRLAVLELLRLQLCPQRKGWPLSQVAAAAEQVKVLSTLYFFQRGMFLCEPRID